MMAVSVNYLPVSNLVGDLTNRTLQTSPKQNPSQVELGTMCSYCNSDYSRDNRDNSKRENAC